MFEIVIRPNNKADIEKLLEHYQFKNPFPNTEWPFSFWTEDLNTASAAWDRAVSIINGGSGGEMSMIETKTKVWHQRQFPGNAENNGPQVKK